MPQIPSGRDLILACAFRASARAPRAILRAIHALHFSFSLECHQGSSSHPVAQSIPALAHRDLYGREDDADRFSGVLAFHLAGAPPSVAILEVDWRDGAVRASESEKLGLRSQPDTPGCWLAASRAGVAPCKLVILSVVRRQPNAVERPQRRSELFRSRYLFPTNALNFLSASRQERDLRPALYFPAAAAPPSTMFTSVPLPTPSNWAAAPRLAAISRYPMLPRMPKISPGAPDA